MPIALQPLEVRSYVGGTLVAEITVLLQSLVDDAFQFRREFGIQTDRRSGDLVQNRVKDRRRGAAFEGKPASTHLIHHHAKGKNVGARVQLLSQGLLGTHVS